MHLPKRDNTIAEVLLQAATTMGVEACFANPGTTELPLVAAMDSSKLRTFLGLTEGVCAGAADGYFRISGTPVLTLLHLGMGAANAIAGLHNASQAGSSILNIVGDHTTAHRNVRSPLRSPLETIASAIGPLSVLDNKAYLNEFARLLKQAVETRSPTTVVVPHDVQAMPASAQIESLDKFPAQRRWSSEEGLVAKAVHALKNRRTLILLDGDSLANDVAYLAAEIAKSHNAVLAAPTFFAKLRRGQNLPKIQRIPYFPEDAMEFLGEFESVILLGADAPVAIFDNPRDSLSKNFLANLEVIPLASKLQGAETVTQQLADALAITRVAVAERIAVPPHDVDDEALTVSSLSKIVANALPAGSIVVDECISSSWAFFDASFDSKEHTLLRMCGGALGFGLPAALGAGLASRKSRIVCLQSDGAAMYSLPALWSLKKYNVAVCIVIYANRQYKVLADEYRRSGFQIGSGYEEMLGLTPATSWVNMASAFDVPAHEAFTTKQFRAMLLDSFNCDGPCLIQANL